MWLSILIVILCFIVFERASNYLIEGLGAISHHFEISEAVLGATIAAMGSSAPEFASSAFSVLENHPAIGLGTIVGSAIFNVTVIIGGSALVGKYMMEKRVLYRDGFFYLITITVTVLTVYDGYLSRIEAMLWATMFFGYMAWLVYDAKKGKPVPKEEFKKISRWKAIVYVVLSIIAIGIAARFMVLQVVELSSAWGVSEGIFSLIIVAIGTSIPDLFTSLQAARKGMGSMAVSNALGSNIFDILAAIGIPFSFRAVTEVEADITLSIVGLLATVVLALGLMRYNLNLTKRQGLLLIGAYIFYVASILLI